VLLGEESRTDKRKSAQGSAGSRRLEACVRECVSACEHPGTGVPMAFPSLQKELHRTRWLDGARRWEGMASVPLD